MAMFTKLLEINIVANKLLGWDKSCFAFCEFLEDISSFISFFSLGDNEKNATSAPEINAENKSRHSNIVISTRSRSVVGIMSKKFVNKTSNCCSESFKLDVFVKRVNHPLLQKDHPLFLGYSAFLYLS